MTASGAPDHADVIAELRALADHIYERAEFIRSIGGSMNAYGALEIIRTRADELEAAGGLRCPPPVPRAPTTPRT